MKYSKPLVAVACAALAFGFFFTLGLVDEAKAGVSNCCHIPCVPPEMGPGHWGYWVVAGPIGSCEIFRDPDTCYLIPGGCALP